MRLQKAASALCLSAMFAIATPASAGGAAAETSTTSVITQNEQKPSQKSIQLLQKYVTATPSGYVLKAPAAVLAQVDKKELQRIRSYHSQLASYIKQGQMVYSNGTYVPKSSMTYATWKTQHAKVVTHWYGLEVGLDSWLTGKIRAGALTAGGIAAYIGGPYGKAIGLALASGSGILGICQKKSGWVYIHWVGVMPPAGGPVCNPF